MIRLTEVYRHVSSKNPAQRYKVRDVYINPEHIRYIRDSSPEIQMVSESKVPGLSSHQRYFCVLSMEKENIIVVGTLKELENKLFGKKVLLNG